jgi:DHA2 family multidrug resistance protein
VITASQQAYGAIYQTLVRQATLLAYIDNFRSLAFLCFICMPAALLFKKVRARAGAHALTESLKMSLECVIDGTF